MSTGPVDFLSCDWGTSSFRLRWVSGPDHTVFREIREPVGIKTLYEDAMRRGAVAGKERADTFGNFLRAKLIEIAGHEMRPGQKLPLVISGMASSTIGWKEVRYATAPFPLDGSGMRSERLDWDAPAWIGATHLLSGIAIADDMMRGEESEAVGILSSAQFDSCRERALLILPGTHSKHIEIESGCIARFRTFMTGELFDVLGRQSLLRASIDIDAMRSNHLPSGTEQAAFEEGARWGEQHGLAAGLFRVRTRAVLGKRPHLENGWFFSGLLIGAELAAISGHPGPVLLGGGRVHSELYRMAGDALGPSCQWIQVPAAEVELAAVRAHALFLRRNNTEPADQS